MAPGLTHGSGLTASVREGSVGARDREDTLRPTHRHVMRSRHTGDVQEPGWNGRASSSLAAHAVHASAPRRAGSGNPGLACASPLARARERARFRARPIIGPSSGVQGAERVDVPAAGEPTRRWRRPPDTRTAGGPRPPRTSRIRDSDSAEASTKKWRTRRRLHWHLGRQPHRDPQWRLRASLHHEPRPPLGPHSDRIEDSYVHRVARAAETSTPVRRTALRRGWHRTCSGSARPCRVSGPGLPATSRAGSSRGSRRRAAR
jgi:hypothetical protein